MKVFTEAADFSGHTEFHVVDFKTVSFPLTSGVGLVICLLMNTCSIICAHNGLLESI